MRTALVVEGSSSAGLKGEGDSALRILVLWGHTTSQIGNPKEYSGDGPGRVFCHALEMPVAVQTVTHDAGSETCEMARGKNASDSG